MLKGFFDAIPLEIEEAAEMDGCSRLSSSTAFSFRSPRRESWRPVFCFVTAWNEFLFGYVLINDDARGR